MSEDNEKTREWTRSTDTRVSDRISIRATQNHAFNGEIHILYAGIVAAKLSETEATELALNINKLVADLKGVDYGTRSHIEALEAEIRNLEHNLRRD